MSKLRKRLDKIIGLYVAEFEEKHECELEYWVADDTTGIACFGDYFFNLSDIVYDIDNNCKAWEIFQWHDYCVGDYITASGKPATNFNFQSYLKGYR